MRNGVNVFLACSAVAALQALLPLAAPAEERGTQDEEVGEHVKQAGEHRWVPSLSISGGATFQNEHGFANSVTEQPPGSPAVPLRGPVGGSDLLVVPYVGAALELMTPALPVFGRPRLFGGGEILPSFSSKRSVALEGDPGCIRGPEADAPCAADEKPGQRVNPFSQSAANGQGTKVTAEIGTLVYGANMGVAFPAALAGRALRLKTSVAWINYEVQATGFVSDATCNPSTRCTNTYNIITGALTNEGNLRETALTASDSRRFNGIGPALEIEVDTGRFGPIGTSLFLGARFYRVLGDRQINFATAASYPEIPTTPPPPPGQTVVPAADSQAYYSVEVNPWLYRAQVGFRLQWLGSD